MDISSINSNTFEAFNSDSAKGKSKLGQQQFLQLLVAQMRNQDPINPLDGTEFASQLAQFNSVEQLIDVNSGLQSLKNSQEMMSASLTNSMAASLTGKQVKALSNEIYLSQEHTPNIHFKLNNSASQVEIVIRSESGSEVRREVIQGVPSGENSWTWDGRSSNGSRAVEGNYTVEINASNDAGEVESLVYTEGLVDKVRYTGEGVFLFVNNVNVPIGDVEEVGSNIF
jgi:flagellar basal-body rod modification protein FlgD